jgi:hypothetical protein
MNVLEDIEKKVGNYILKYGCCDFYNNYKPVLAYTHADLSAFNRDQALFMMEYADAKGLTDKDGKNPICRYIDYHSVAFNLMYERIMKENNVKKKHDQLFHKDNDLITTYNHKVSKRSVA